MKILEVNLVLSGAAVGEEHVRRHPEQGSAGSRASVEVIHPVDQFTEDRGVLLLGESLGCVLRPLVKLKLSFDARVGLREVGVVLRVDDAPVGETEIFSHGFEEGQELLDLGWGLGGPPHV
jgi:hypothetical protein